LRLSSGRYGFFRGFLAFLPIPAARLAEVPRLASRKKNPFLEKNMRYTMLAVVALTVGIATPALAAKMQNTPAPSANVSAPAPSFDDCYRLAWVRGVHVELGELPGFNAECMAGKIPFESGSSADSIRRTK
jgi:hypothetical protein